MAGSVVVTDGSDSFYNSRAIFQLLHDFGKFKSITASSSSVSDAKKMLLSRQARYSGLVDVLSFTEADISEAFAKSDTWLAINADEAKLESQLAQAKAAGVKRVFITLSADGPTPSLSNPEAMRSTLEASGLEFTVLRTGKVVPTSGGGGLKIAEIDAESCEDVPREDVYRFITECLTLPEANGRLFSLLPSADDSQFREMRQAGCDRREEAQALLAGVIVEKVPEEAPTAKQIEISEEEARKSKIESDAEAEEEVKMLLEKARARGIENEKKRKEEEAALAAKRAERAQYYIAPKEGEEEEEGKKVEGEKKDDDDDAPPPPPPSPPSPPGPDGKGGDGPKEPPLAMA